MKHLPVLISVFIVVAACDVDQTPPWAPDTVCARSCAGEEGTPCPGAPSQSECIATCEQVRASRPACLAEDTAFRQCFVQFTVVCIEGRRATRSCDAEAAAVAKCLARYGDAGGAVDANGSADGEAAADVDTDADGSVGTAAADGSLQP